MGKWEWYENSVHSQQRVDFSCFVFFPKGFEGQPSCLLVWSSLAAAVAKRWTWWPGQPSALLLLQWSGSASQLSGDTQLQWVLPFILTFLCYMLLFVMHVSIKVRKTWVFEFYRANCYTWRLWQTRWKVSLYLSWIWFELVDTSMILWHQNYLNNKLSNIWIVMWKLKSSCAQTLRMDS